MRRDVHQHGVMYGSGPDPADAVTSAARGADLCGGAGWGRGGRNVPTLIQVDDKELIDRTDTWGHLGPFTDGVTT